MKILLSEGCPIFREGMKFVLKNAGYKVTCAESREQFCHLFSCDYDLVIMDLDFLKTKAIELAEHYYAWSTPYNKTVKIIASYKDSPEYYVAHLFDAGLRKPFTKEKLLHAIKKEYTHVKRFNDKTNSRSTGNVYYQSMV